jgi:hypothetical protein
MKKAKASGIWVSVLIVLGGCIVEYYAHALGALLLSECSDLGPAASGRCASPRHWAIVGIVMIVGGLAALVFALLRRQRS